MALKIAVGQLGFWVGDVQGNVDRIVRAALDARDRLHADLLVCPEMCLLGYPPDDLLLRPAVGDVIARGVERLLRELHGIAVVVGVPEISAEHRTYNAALVIRDGAILAHYRKRLLPNYGVFDEKRHFCAGAEPTVFDYRGTRVGLCICEDTWQPGPAAETQAAGAELVVSINASPFTRTKRTARRAMLAARCSETAVPILYVNAVGGQDDLVFDGGSCAVDAKGTLCFQAPAFVEGVFGCDYADGRFTGASAPDAGDDELLYTALVTATRDYIDRNGFPGALVGLSGGIDSALVAAIAADALGPSRVWTVSLPSRYTADMSNDDARAEAETLGVRYSVLPIEPVVSAATTALAPSFAGQPPGLAEENLQARARGLLLMALSNKFGHLLLATGNKSEMAVGYATLYGDMCGGFAPIKDVYKTLVYRLARYRNEVSPVIPQRTIDRAPTAELRPEQKDSDSLPPYPQLDAILEAYVDDSRSIERIVEGGQEHKTVARVAAMVRRAEYKRRQAPPGPKVSRRAFGRERRYPITAVYDTL
ncbi:MAG TPA: NAD+ synthase [Nevskiaceae bacterium]|nr:NAD+ synthase [Nevskiaceae bacterium]